MSDNSIARTKWIDMIQTGGATPLFSSYPDDAELLDALASLFRFDANSGEFFSVDDIAAHRARFYSMPIRGEQRDENIGSPTKHVIRNKAMQLNVQEALAEIVDNIFDNFEREQTDSSQLNVDLTFCMPLNSNSGDHGELIVRENSGGIPKHRIVPLIQLGLSDRSTGGIGAWGEGFKIAAFALGDEVEVFSHYNGEEPVSIHFPKGWLDPKSQRWKEWKVSTYEIRSNPPPERSTLIRISHLNVKTADYLKLTGTTDERRQFCGEMAFAFGEIYSEKYHALKDAGQNVRITITLGDVSAVVDFLSPVEQRLRDHLAFLPWLTPIRWTRTFDALSDDKQTVSLKLTIYAGLSATDGYSKSYEKTLSKPGVEMWGNGRLFSLTGRIDDESVGWGYTFGGRGGKNPTANTNTRRIIVIALFEANDSRTVPWVAPVKNDYNRRSEFYAEIKEALALAIRLYKDAPTPLEFVLLPFSAHWQTLDDGQKFNILFRDVDGADLHRADFVNSRFGLKILRFQADPSFKVLLESESNPTVAKVFNSDTFMISRLKDAAVVTKASYEDRTRFLKAMFPAFSAIADIEEELGLFCDEELDV